MKKIIATAAAALSLAVPLGASAASFDEQFDGGNGTPYLPYCGPSASGLYAYYNGRFYLCHYAADPATWWQAAWHWHDVS